MAEVREDRRNLILFAEYCLIKEIGSVRVMKLRQVFMISLHGTEMAMLFKSFLSKVFYSY